MDIRSLAALIYFGGALAYALLWQRTIIDVTRENEGTLNGLFGIENLDTYLGVVAGVILIALWPVTALWIMTGIGLKGRRN